VQDAGTAGMKTTFAGVHDSARVVLPLQKIFAIYPLNVNI
jgi:hypothetical protein